MPKLSNDYKQCTLLNLGYGSGGRGPYVIRQDAYPPGSVSFRDERFLLRKDGTWVLSLAVYALPEDGKEKFLFDKSAEAIELLGHLGELVVEDSLPPNKSVKELQAAAESTITGIWSRIRNAKTASFKS